MAADFLDTELDETRKAQAAAAAQQQQTELASGAVLNPWAGSALQGLTYGFGDEATAGVRSLFGTPYQDALSQERAQQSQFAQAHPYANVGTQIVGALPHIVLSRGKTGPVTVKRAMTDAAIRGGAEGGVQGFGEGEGGLGPRLLEGGLGLGMGSILSAPMELLSRGVAAGGKALWNRVAPAFSPAAADKAAADKLAQTIQRDGGMPEVKQNVDRYGQQVAENTQAGLPDPKLTLGEVAGGQSKAALDAALAMPGRGAGDVTKDLIARQQGRLGRVREALTNTFGDMDDQFTAKMKLYESRKATADPLYKAAFDGARPPQALDIQLMQQLPEAAVRDAQQIARMEGRGLSFKPKFKEDGTLDIEASGIPTVEDMHRLKVGLDNYIQTNSPNGVPNALANRASTLRNTVRDRVDELTTDHNGVSLYKQAREHWSGDTTRIEAINLGRRAVDMDQHELRAQLARMTESERSYFVNGFMSDMTDRLNSVHQAGNQNPVRQVFSTQKQMDAAETALTTLGLSKKEIGERMTQLKNYFEHEATGHGNEGSLTRGSPTAQRTAWQRDLAAPTIASGVTTAALTGSPWTTAAVAGSTLLATGAKAVNQMRTEKMNDAMLRILGNSDPAQQQVLLAALERNAQQRMIGAPRGAGARAGATIAGQGGAEVVDDVNDQRRLGYQ